MEAYKIFISFTIFLFLLSILIAINKFIGNKLFKILKGKFPSINHTLYLIIFWIMTSFIWISYFTRNKIKLPFNDVLMTIGLLWVVILPIMFILEIIVVIIDKIIKENKIKENKLIKSLSYLYTKGIIQIVISLIIVTYGFYNVHNVHIKTYELSIDKKADIDSLNIVFLADTHGLYKYNSSVFKNNSLSNLVNSLDADIILLGGDLIDELSQNNKIDLISSEIKEFKSKYGTFGVLGNHDYRANTDIFKFFNESNIILLKDDIFEIEGIYIAGSDYKENNDYNLFDILDFDSSKPIIHLIHVPSKSSEDINNIVDLQLSGHTHAGQVFPLNLITNALFYNDYGYKINNNTHTITTSGFGVWGPRVRIGSNSEIVNIRLTFQN